MLCALGQSDPIANGSDPRVNSQMGCKLKSLFIHMPHLLSALVKKAICKPWICCSPISQCRGYVLITNYVYVIPVCTPTVNRGSCPRPREACTDFVGMV